MDIIDNIALKTTLPTQFADQILSSIGESELINDYGMRKDIAVYWGYEEASAMAEILDSGQPDLTIPSVPSPMLRDYKWPGLRQPFRHQKETASFLSLRRRAFCFNEAGTGKTSAAIWAADYLMQAGLIKRVLVICPLSIMYSAWQADIFATTMHRTCGIAHGDANKRKKVLAENCDFTIINYDGTHVVFNELLAASFDLIIVDEANAYKTATTRRWKTLAKLITPDTRLWMMTGTPASQSPIDAFGLARLISPNRLPRYVTAWRDRVMKQISRFKWIPKDSAKGDVFYALQPAIRFIKRECLDLPDVVYQTRDVPLTPQVEKYYKILKAQMLIEAGGEQISAVNAAASLNKLLQISGGAVYTDQNQVVDFDIKPRLSALQEVLDETSNKVVVFVPFLHTIELVKNYLVQSGYTTEVINGSVAAKERSEIINRFQTQTDPKILVIQPQSASHGVTLTAADTIVFWSPVMSVETYLQCVARIDRHGQKHTMSVVHLQSTEVERKMYKMLQGKIDSHQKLVDLYKQEMEGSTV